MMELVRILYNEYSGTSRHSAGGSNVECFLVSHIYLFDGLGPKSIAKLDGGHGRIFLPGSPTERKPSNSSDCQQVSNSVLCHRQFVSGGNCSFKIVLDHRTD